MYLFLYSELASQGLAAALCKLQDLFLQLELIFFRSSCFNHGSLFLLLWYTKVHYMLEHTFSCLFCLLKHTELYLLLSCIFCNRLYVLANLRCVCMRRAISWWRLQVMLTSSRDNVEPNLMRKGKRNRDIYNLRIWVRRLWLSSHWWPQELSGCHRRIQFHARLCPAARIWTRVEMARSCGPISILQVGYRHFVFYCGNW